MSCLTKLFHHTGTTSATDIGPATGGVVHSIIYVYPPGANTATIRDGGSGGTIVFFLNATSEQKQNRFEGVKLTGQLNIALSHADVHVVVEMSELP